MDILFGGFDSYFRVLLILMICDYISGVLTALYKKVFHSSIGYKGIIKKVGMLICIAAVSQIDTLNICKGDLSIRSTVLTFFVINETLSIFENLKKIGISIPKSIKDKIKK